MKEKRRDSKERILHTGESQRTDGKYLYKYVDAFGTVSYTHLNSKGVADSYQSKLWGVTFIYLVIFACHWFAAIITSVDPRRRNISSKIYRCLLYTSRCV